MVASYIPATQIPGIGRITGTCWSFTDFIFGALRCAVHAALCMLRCACCASVRITGTCWSFTDFIFGALRTLRCARCACLPIPDAGMHMKCCVAR
jgi:hypothetical protein